MNFLLSSLGLVVVRWSEEQPNKTLHDIFTWSGQIISEIVVELLIVCRRSELFFVEETPLFLELCEERNAWAR